MTEIRRILLDGYPIQVVRDGEHLVAPDGRRIAFVSWVWPELKGSQAQAKRHKAFKSCARLICCLERLLEIRISTFSVAIKS